MSGLNEKLKIQDAPRRHAGTAGSDGDGRSPAPLLDDLIAERISRRTALTGLTAVAALTGLPGGLMPGGGEARAASGKSSLTFTELKRIYDETDHVAPGYSKKILLRWGDPVLSGAPVFDSKTQTGADQEKQFGYNADYIAYMPLPRGSDSSDHGLLCINHEYPDPQLMWDGIAKYGDSSAISKDQADILMAGTGHAVVEVEKVGGDWRVVAGSRYNRRISANTEMRVSGPAAGNPKLQTSADPTGAKVIGTHGNCAGGKTPWGTVLTCEEYSTVFFGGKAENTPYKDYLARNHFYDPDYYGWGKYYDRFNVDKEPNEFLRYEWVVEFDPYDPNSVPVKRTALGRFGHEGATTVVNKDGRVVVYMGDDARFEYLYKFVTTGRYDPNNRDANRGLLDEGTLYAARLNADGSGDWLPLVHGQGSLTGANGFNSQADVCIDARRAGDLVGATGMDRPEDFEPNPVTGRVYAAMTKNRKRKDDQANASNPRAGNLWGHIVELIQPGEGADTDHAATSFRWEVFILAGDPSDPKHAAKYHPDVSASGWFVNPDNIVHDPKGRLWVSSDSGNKWGADGLYGMDTVGPARALPKLLYAGPKGSEIAGPEFTPDGQTLFVAVQHPAEDAENLKVASTRWPDFDDNVPPRPSVVAITRDGGGEIGS